MNAEPKKKPRTVAEEDVPQVFRPITNQKLIANLFAIFFANSKKLGLTNQQTAVLLDVSLPTLSRFKAGKLPKYLNQDKNMRMYLFFKIMKNLTDNNIDPRDFFFQKGLFKEFGNLDPFSHITALGILALNRAYLNVSSAG